jgi:uncharacterized protein YbjT (DUF2867 family)
LGSDEKREQAMKRQALVAGVTGLIGSNLAEHLISKNWEVHGIARKPNGGIRGVRPIASDLLDPESLRTSLADVNPTHVFFTTWVRRATEEENVAANGALVRNERATHCWEFFERQQVMVSHCFSCNSLADMIR